TTPRPATGPAKRTTPGPAARTTASGDPARSTPRCPGSHRRGGGSNGLVTTTSPDSGGRNGPATAAACDVNGAVGAAGRAGAAAASATSTSISTTGPTRATRAHRTRRTDAAPPVDVGTPRCPPGSATPRACRTHPGRSTVRPHAVDGSQPCGQRPRTGAGMVGAPASSRRSTPAGRASPSTRRGGTMEARSDGEGSPGMAQGGGAAKVVLYV